MSGFPPPNRPRGAISDEPDALPAGLATDAETGLAPDAEALDRVRSIAIAQFRVAAARSAARPLSTPAPRRWWDVLRRPAFAAGMAGALLLGSFGLVAANSGPGDAFYGLRLAAEGLSLPFAGGDPTTRSLDRLQQRLDEAQRQSSDPTAVSAAIKAYQDELRRALAEAKDEPPRQKILGALGVHGVALATLEQTAPNSAISGIDQARDQVGQAQQQLRATPTAAPIPGAAETPTVERSAKPTETHRPSTR